MNKNLINFVYAESKKILGVILIIGGFFGLFLPFLQGIAMIIAGFALLGHQKFGGTICHVKKQQSWAEYFSIEWEKIKQRF